MRSRVGVDEREQLLAQQRAYGRRVLDAVDPHAGAQPLDELGGRARRRGRTSSSVSSTSSHVSSSSVSRESSVEQAVPERRLRAGQPRAQPDQPAGGGLRDVDAPAPRPSTHAGAGARRRRGRRRRDSGRRQDVAATRSRATLGDGELLASHWRRDEADDQQGDDAARRPAGRTHDGRSTSIRGGAPIRPDRRCRGSRRARAVRRPVRPARASRSRWLITVVTPSPRIETP